MSQTSVIMHRKLYVNNLTYPERTGCVMVLYKPSKMSPSDSEISYQAYRTRYQPYCYCYWGSCEQESATLLTLNLCQSDQSQLLATTLCLQQHPTLLQQQRQQQIITSDFRFTTERAVGNKYLTCT